MTHERIRMLCLAQPAATEDQPFDSDSVVFRIGGKIFALLALDAFPPRLNLKCDPERAAELRERYAAVMPGYHMNKRHWNTVVCDGSVPAGEIEAMIAHAYGLVRSGLPKKVQQDLP